MKRVIFFILVAIVGYAFSAEAQTGKKPVTQKAVNQGTLVKKAYEENTAVTQDSVFLTSGSANQAYGPAFSQQYYIADPTIKALNQRAAGYDVFVGSSGIIGMPKRKYGFANGKLLLRNTTAPSSGTMYGSGAVGTGTAIMGVGTGEAALGVNGKNPYAGPWLWGSKLPVSSPVMGDSVNRRW